MKQPGVLVLLISFIAVVSFMVASQEAKNDGFITVTLTGANEVNGLGDADGNGVFRYSVKTQEQTLCYEVLTSNIAAATSATINSGDRFSSGNVVVTLDAPATGRSQGCVSIKSETLSDIKANPSRYYITVIHAQF